MDASRTVFFRNRVILSKRASEGRHAACLDGTGWLLAYDGGITAKPAEAMVFPSHEEARDAITALAWSGMVPFSLSEIRKCLK